MIYREVVMRFLVLALTFCFLFASCSGPKSAQDISEDAAGMELSDADDLLSDSESEDEDDLFAELEDDEAEVEAVSEEPAEEFADADDEEEEADEATEEVAAVQEEQPMEMSEDDDASEMNTEMMASSKPVIEAVGEEKTYTVKKNDTLMLIAFNIYGDFTKWKELMKHNNDKLKGNPANLSAGMNIKYYHSGDEFVWNPGGNPYLIKWGDTLGKISDNVYGTNKKWKDIWHHNEPLIKDPNRIYVGFTIYYLEEDGRGVASP
jgi:nucleoid-associated protein YgaU